MSETGPEKPVKDTEHDNKSKETKTEETSILSIFSFLNELREKRRDVKAALEKLNAAGYGPRKWEFIIKTEYKKRYDVLQLGRGFQSLMVKRPLIESNFKNIKELHLHAQNALSFLVNEAFALYEEPKTTSLNAVLSIDPERLGLPIDDMCMSERPAENVCAAIQPYCIATRLPNINYSQGFIAEGIDLYPLRESAFALSRDEMRPLRQIVIDHEDYLLEGVPDSSPHRILHGNDILNIIANPFNLNSIFEHLPLAIPK